MPPRFGSLCFTRAELIAAPLSRSRAQGPDEEGGHMKTRESQGSFIDVIRTLMAKVQQLSAANVSIPPRADLVAGFLLLPIASRSVQRRRAEETRLSNLVFRYSSS